MMKKMTKSSLSKACFRKTYDISCDIKCKPLGKAMFISVTDSWSLAPGRAAELLYATQGTKRNRK